MTEQYDSIADRYSESHAVPLRAHVEQHTIESLVGDLRGRRVLDLACGDGYYSRLWKRRGAAEVVGVDISGPMVALAIAAERDHPLGIRYHVGDVATLPEIGRFDLVTAIYLLHYAPSRDALTGMARAIAAHLEPGGRLVGMVANPDYDPRGPVSTKYGVTPQLPVGHPDGAPYMVTAHFDPPIEFQVFHWSRDSYERALRDAGFSDVRWGPVSVSAAGVKAFGAPYWSDYLANPHAVPVEAIRR